MDNKSSIPGLGWLQHVATKSVFKAICDEYALVYFGAVNQHSDEHEMIRGVTLSPNHQDRHYSVGTIHNHDVILVERTDTVRFPGKHSEEYTWIILQVDLKGIDMPHTFVDAHHHDEVFYDNLFAKFARLTHVDKGVFADYDPLFLERFNVYATPDGADLIPVYLTFDAASTLAHHFGHFDFEWYQDRLVIYSTGRPATKHLIENMIRAGTWLADELNASGPKKSASTFGVETDSN
jgi:hypothetical protein